MTLTIAWTRTIRDTQELLIASDSRLTGNGHVDLCPKLFPLPREDIAIGFCGDTIVAYPFMLQVINHINLYAKSRDRALDINDLRHRIIEVLNDFRREHKDPVDTEFDKENLTTEFIVGGWSWKFQRFEIFKIVYQAGIGKFSFRPSANWRGQGDNEFGRGKKIAIAGDYVDYYRSSLIKLLKERSKLGRGGFDMEPLEVLRDMLRNERFTNRRLAEKGLIGGAPQVVKIYPHPNTLPIAVYWGDRPDIHIFGRRLLPYEKTTFPILDTDTMKMAYPLKSIEN